MEEPAVHYSAAKACHFPNVRATVEERRFSAAESVRKMQGFSPRYSFKSTCSTFSIG